MASKSNLVNLDAMIEREDFAAEKSEGPSFEKIQNISLEHFSPTGLIGPNLRKPDFQRETNHWSPNQVLSLLECFINGDLIPSVILWQSPSYLFVIDGGHRISVLRGWVENDYGDGHISLKYFDGNIANSQRKAADRTRKLIDENIGSWQQFSAKAKSDTSSPEEKKKITVAITRGLPIQWITGNADKAEASFFRINTSGTPLDSIEELLLRNRRKPIPISARAIIRAGTGHKYWSSFSEDKLNDIESKAKEIHDLIFEPEYESPVKTLELPLAGSKGVRDAIQVLIELVLIANKNQQGLPSKIEDYFDDIDGSLTVDVLKKTYKLINRITGNKDGSLGLHPAVYFYGPTARHSGPMFMGTVSLIGKKLSNNDSNFFKKFTKARSELESILINNKDLLAAILQKHSSYRRAMNYENILDALINGINDGDNIDESYIVNKSNLSGKVIHGSELIEKVAFSDTTKSKAFMKKALESALKCTICSGFLDPLKSVSYDHIQRVQDGGKGGDDNIDLTHPYCNQSVKQ